MGQEPLRRSQMDYWPVTHEGEGSNCFSNKSDRKGNNKASTNTSWRNIYLGIKQKKETCSIAPILLLEDFC